MRLYGAIDKVVPLDDGTVRVHGIASAECVDDQNEIVRADAMRAAIPDYMRFPALREMHQLSAAGCTLEADVGDDGKTRVVAHVVDPTAVLKVKNQVYRGFSIGGRVTQREAGNPKVITGIVWNELSLVDRPANPDAVFDCWKASWQGERIMQGGSGALAETPSTAPFNAPIQVWACGNPEHRHLAKSEAVKCIEAGNVAVEKHATDGAAAAQAQVEEALAAVEAGKAALADLEQRRGLGTDPTNPAEKADKPEGDYGSVHYADPGYQEDKKPRYPLDTKKRVTAAWDYIHMPKNAGKYTAEQVDHIKSEIKAAGKKFDIEFSDDSAKATQAALQKSLWDIGEAAELVARLRAMCERLEIERAMEGDESATPDSCEAACAAACALLQALVTEETQEVLDDTEIDEPVEMGEMMMSAIIGCLSKSIADPNRMEALVSALNKLGARHNASDKAQLDTAAYAIHRAMGIGTAKRAEMANMVDAHKAVLDAGATNLGADGREVTSSNPMQGADGATQHSTVDTGRNGSGAAPNPTGAVPSTPVPGEAQPGNQKAVSVEELMKASDPRALIEGMVKGGSGHKELLQASHDLLHAVSDGSTCKEGVPKPARHSASDWANMHKAHGSLMMVDGVKCAAANELPGGAPESTGESETQGTSTTAGGMGSDRGEPGKDAAAATQDLAKRLADSDEQNAVLAKALTDIVPVMQAMKETIDKIAATPLPPAAIARLPDSAGNGTRKASLSTDEVTEALAAMSAQDRTLTTIKASYRNPMVLHGFTDGPGAWRRPEEK